MTQRIMITGPERRRHWSAEEKLAILVEAFAPKVSPIEVARQHGCHSAWGPDADRHRKPLS